MAGRSIPAGLPCRHGRWTLGAREGGGMRRVAITLALGLLCCLVAIMAQAQAPAHDEGIVRIDRLSVPAAGMAGSGLDVTPGTASVRSDRLEGAEHGSGWWRLQPQAATGRRLLLVFHPYTARLTVRL